MKPPLYPLMTFISIPQHILEDERVDDSTAILIGHLLNLSQDMGFTTMTNEELGKLTGCCAREVSKRLKSLDDAGYLTRKRQNLGCGTERKIYPVLGGVK